MVKVIVSILRYDSHEACFVFSGIGGRATNKQFCNPTHDCPACKNCFKVKC